MNQAARYPLSAGEAVYVQKGLGFPALSVMVGLLIVLMGAVSAATIARGFVGYLDILIELPDAAAITLLVLVLGATAIWGIVESVRIAALITLIELLGLVLVPDTGCCNGCDGWSGAAAGARVTARDTGQVNQFPGAGYLQSCEPVVTAYQMARPSPRRSAYDSTLDTGGWYYDEPWITPVSACGGLAPAFSSTLKITSIVRSRVSRRAAAALPALLAR